MCLVKRSHQTKTFDWTQPQLQHDLTCKNTKNLIKSLYFTLEQLSGSWPMSCSLQVSCECSILMVIHLQSIHSFHSLSLPYLKDSLKEIIRTTFSSTGGSQNVSSMFALLFFSQRVSGGKLKQTSANKLNWLTQNAASESLTCTRGYIRRPQRTANMKKSSLNGMTANVSLNLKNNKTLKWSCLRRVSSW